VVHRDQALFRNGGVRQRFQLVAHSCEEWEVEHVDEEVGQILIDGSVELTGSSVTLQCESLIFGLDNTEWRPYIERADYEADGGIKVLEDFDVIGHITLYVSVYHNGGDFGVFSDKDTMVFGNDGDPFDPDLEISGASLNAKVFTASRGKIKFYQMKFAGTAPKWLIQGEFVGGALTGTTFATGQITNVPP
jgi:hypothetical protein